MPSAAYKAYGIWQMAYGIWYAEFPLLPRLPLLHAMQGDRPARSELFISRQLLVKVRYRRGIRYLESLVNRWMVLARTQAHAR